METEYNEYDTDRCEVCGEKFGPNAQIAEMHDPDEDEGSYICHVQCGLNKDFQVA